MSITNWEERPWVTREQMALFKARDRKTAKLYGPTVAAAEIANVDFKLRYAKFSRERKMSDPPSCGRIFMGYLVVRRLNTPEEYEKQIAVFVSRPKNRSSIAGGTLISIDEFMSEVRSKVAACGIMASNAISEQYPLLRTIQLAQSGYYRLL